ncbi:phospholipid methyltransferase-domain-containing protein [Pisolithus orientalis]|uniref:phospholipid methyltransferase-domain-containing protein n=1 Tax=Pisolithus orientalis TaxID=936130 RepID=UPI002225B34B|nr:phospholipid methyltransferase-domain-containing protein [Pisolithus orientalis]KAI6002379.1 phospholipid methyltransferase-domain-containing protein [Pisolithus orientalis]
MGALASVVNASAPSLYISLLSITFNSTAWNMVARNCTKKTITRAFSSPYHGCYFLAILIFTFGLVRDHLYQCALLDQPHVPLLPEPLATLVPVLLFIVGQVFVLTLTYALEITGTFLGGYFGILTNDRVEGFPFNVLRDPMYVGSTLCFAATALWCYKRPAGLLITLYVYIVYLIALRYEGPFTDMIYSSHSEVRKEE